MKKFLRNNKGITLVALVVTIIVLIILAAVSINLVLGENGIIKKAQEGAANSEKGRENESIQIALGELRMSNNGYLSFDEASLEAAIEKNGGEDVEVTKTDDNTYTVKYVKSGREYPVELEAKVLDPGLYDENDNIIASWDELITAGLKTSGCDDYRTNNSEFLNNYTNGKKIVIPDTINSITDYMFYECENLTSIIMPKTITSIGEWSFEYCKSLKSITIPNSITSIEDGTFYGCKSLKSITIPNSVTSIEYAAFSGCESLTSVRIPSSVTEINGSNHFYGCKNLKDLIIEANITTIPEYFAYGCENLANVKFPSTLTKINGQAFDYTFQNGGVFTIPAGVTIDRYILSNAKLDKLIIEDNCVITSTQGLTNTSGGFSDNGELVVGKNVTIGGSSFLRNCQGLKKITIGDGCTIGDYAFAYNNNIKEVNLGKVKNIGNSAFCYTSYNGTGYSINIPNTVKTIGNSAFNTAGLTGITFEENSTLESIGDSAFSISFGFNIESVTVPDCVTTVGTYAFHNIKNVNYHGTATGAPWDAETLNNTSI